MYYVYIFRLVVQTKFIQQHSKYCLTYFINVNGAEFRRCSLDAFSAIRPKALIQDRVEGTRRMRKIACNSSGMQIKRNKIEYRHDCTGVTLHSFSTIHRHETIIVRARQSRFMFHKRNSNSNNQ